MKTILLISILLVSCSSKQEKKETKFADLSIESGCASGAAKSCLALGQTVEKQEPQNAQMWFTKACDLGNPLGCLSAGEIMLIGDGMNLKGAIKSFVKGCDLEEPAACYGAGIVESGVYGGSAHITEAQKYYRRACEYGLADGCAQNFILQLEHAQSKEKMSAALVGLKSLCTDAEKVSMACYSLGEYLHDLEPDQSLFWFSEGCKYGDGSACLAAGFASMPKTTKSGKENAEHALSFFEKGCLAKEKDWVSCSLFGYSKYNAGGESEKSEALLLLKTTCENEAEGCFRMALIEDEPVWIKKACQMSPKRCEFYKRVLLKRKSTH